MERLYFTSALPKWRHKIFFYDPRFGTAHSAKDSRFDFEDCVSIQVSSEVLFVYKVFENAWLRYSNIGTDALAKVKMAGPCWPRKYTALVALTGYVFMSGGRTTVSERH